MSWGYAAIMTAAVGVGVWTARCDRYRLPLGAGSKLGIALGAYCGAMIGAKLPFVFADWSQLIGGGAWFADGKTILTGLVGGYFGVEIAKWCLDLKLKTGDAFAVSVPLAIAVGRLGCYYAGCCYGMPTDLPWGVVFSNVDDVPRHPTQLYEAVFHVACAVLLAWLRDRRSFPRQLIKLYILLYAAFRIATETIRPEVRLWGGFTGYQAAAAVMIGLFAWLWYRDAVVPPNSDPSIDHENGILNASPAKGACPALSNSWKQPP